MEPTLTPAATDFGEQRGQLPAAVAAASRILRIAILLADIGSSLAKGERIKGFKSMRYDDSGECEQ